MTAPDNAVLKESFKDAIREIILENKELLREILVEAMEDVDMSHALKEGNESAAVDRKIVLQTARTAGECK